MNTLTLARDARVAGTPATLQPTIALVFPFDPKMTPKSQIEAAVKRILAMAEEDLLARHSAEEAMPVLKRLQQALRGLNYSTHKRSVAVWVSPAISGTTYMDFAVEERIFIDQPFRVRDLADCKPSGKEYLLLLLSGRESKMYLKTGNGLKLIKSNGPQTIYAYLNEVPERTGNFSDPGDRHEVMLNKFLHHMDAGLGQVLKAYPLPVFVAGAERITGHFARITRHTRNIAGYVYKHCMDARENELESLLQPMLDNWRQLRHQLLLLQLEKAAEAGKLVCGLEEVRKAARCSNSRLLVIENSEASAHEFFTDGPLDAVVEKVLSNGGDVEKLDSRLMTKYGPIVLIRYY
ncbi:MAG TPA: hypothetical protein VG605_13435 [Puia sp.]|nr:hypothetical protein [Puia sp.]